MAKRRKPGHGAVYDTKETAQEPLNERPRSPSVNPVLGLQRTIGNRAVNELLAPGAKPAGLRVSNPGEPEEVEADRVSREVTGVESGGAQVGHTEMHSGAGYSATDPATALGGGTPMDDAIRSDMETRLGHDLRNVRIHTDSRAAESARAVDARAYTVGKDVVFAAGEYAPDKKEGKQLLVHELTHVIQQGASRPTSPQAKTIGGSNQQKSADKVLQRQPTPQTVPPQLTQALYDRAIAILVKLPGANAELVAILKQGKVGQTVSGVKQIKVPAPTPKDFPAELTCNLEIAAGTGGLRQGAAAQFVEEPASQINIQPDPVKGIMITRLLKIIAKPAATDDEMAWSLLHEGIHMMLAIDRMLDSLSGIVPGLTAGATGVLKSFAQYQQAGKSSKQRAGLVSALVSEINRVKSASAAPPSTPSPAPSGKPPATTPSTPPAAPAQSANAMADDVIDMILEERFAFDQQLKQFPGSKTVANSLLADAYMFDQLAFELGLKSWPAPPNKQALITLMTAFLDDVELTLNPPAPPTTKPAPSAPPPKKP
jgi:uncharacterized protein DUF4157